MLVNLGRYLDGNNWSIFPVCHPNIDQISPACTKGRKWRGRVILALAKMKKIKSSSAIDPHVHILAVVWTTPSSIVNPAVVVMLTTPLSAFDPAIVVAHVVRRRPNHCLSLSVDNTAIAVAHVVIRHHLPALWPTSLPAATATITVSRNSD